VEQHNEQVENAVAFLVKQAKLCHHETETAEERSCIWVENGHFYGMGYIASDIGFTDPGDGIMSLLTKSNTVWI
jgi:DNA polymerase-3 subunit epsilon